MLGQQKLFQRLVPGLMHAFIFWGFLVLFPTIVMAMIGAVDRDWSIPVARPPGLVRAAGRPLRRAGAGRASRPRCGSARSCGRERFEGSHLGEADLILALIALVVADAAALARGAHRRRAERVAGRLVAALERALARCSAAARAAVLRARVRLGARVRHPRLPRVPAALEAPAHRDGGDQRLVRPHAPRAAGSSRSLRRARGRDALRRRHGRRPDVEGDGRHVLVHRVRPLPGRLPGVRDRQGAVAEAPDHGPARPGVRRGPEPRSRGGEASSPIAGNAVPEEVVWDCVTCGACVHECPVSIEHVDHIVDLRRHLVMVESRFPAEAEPMLRDVERVGEPVGQAAGRARRLGRGARRARARSPASRRPRSSTGSAAPPPSTSARATRRSRRRSCCRRRASTSRSSARASRAPAIPRGGWATSTCSRRTPSRTSRR